MNQESPAPARRPLRALLAIDGSPAATDGARSLAHLHECGLPLEVTAVCVEKPLMAGDIGPLVTTDLVLAEREAEARARLAPIEQLLAEAGVACRAVKRLGEPVEVLLQMLGQGSFDLAAVGRRGRGALGSALLGSVSHGLIEHSPVPVLIVNAQSELPLTSPLRVLVASDASPAATRAADVAAQWAGSLSQVELHLVHVQQGMTLIGTLLAPRSRLVEQWSGAEAKAAFAEAQAAPHARGHRWQVHAVHADDAADAILKLQQELGCALVTLGTRGLGPLSGMLLGSVTQTVLAQSKVPVLLVR